MLGWLFGKKKPKVDPRDFAVNNLPEILSIQLALGSYEERYPDPQSMIEDKFFIGYLNGFCDATFQSMGINDEVESIASTTVVLDKLFGLDAATAMVVEITSQFDNFGSDADFTKGLMTGGQEATDFWKRKTRTPTKLAMHMMEKHTIEDE